MRQCATFVDVYGRLAEVYLFLSEHRIDFSLRIFTKTKYRNWVLQTPDNHISQSRGELFTYWQGWLQSEEIFLIFGFSGPERRGGLFETSVDTDLTWSQLYSEKLQVEAEHLDLLIIFAFLPSSLAFKLGFIRVPNRSRKFDQKQGKLSR